MKALFLLVTMLVLSSFTNEPAEYQWSSNYKVQVKDFQVDAYLGKRLASISTGIGMNKNYNGTYSFRAVAIADRKQSKINPKILSGYRLQEVLNHEQLHFDIAEYVSRRLNSHLVNIKDLNTAEKLFAQYTDTLSLIQMVYDAQTDHSNDPIWQDKWSKNMDSLLNGQKIFTQWKMYPY